MVDHRSIRRAREIAEEIGLGGEDGGQIHAAVYGNDQLIDVLGSREVDDLKTKLRHLDRYISKLATESSEEIAAPDFLVSRDALLDDIKEWFETRSRAEPATERLMDRVAEFIRSSEEKD